MNRISHSSILCLLCACSILWQCKHEPDPIDPIVPPLNLNEIIAGKYVGTAVCTVYNGSSYFNEEYPSNIEMQAVSTDSLKLAASDGCVYEPYLFVLELDTYKVDPVTMTNIHYSIWKNIAQYHNLYYYPANDSIEIYTPEHYSPGWLGRAFHGKKI